MADDVNGLRNMERIEKGDDVPRHRRLAEVAGAEILGRAAGASVVRRNAPVSLCREEGEDVAELERGLREPVEQDDDLVVDFVDGGRLIYVCDPYLARIG